MTNSNYKLTKEDFKQINKRSLFTFQLGWNYERMQASGYLYMLLPQLRKMYGDGTPELKEMMKLHTQFFNTSPFFHTIITGFDLALEEKRWCQIKRCGERDQDRSHGTIRSSLGTQSLDHWYQLLWVQSQQLWLLQETQPVSSCGSLWQLLMTFSVGNSWNLPIKKG